MAIEVDEEWAELRVYAIPEVPEDYRHVRFFVKCGIRDSFGVLKFERLQSVTTEFLLTSSIWTAGRRLLWEENLIQSNLLWVVCTIEPESKWEDCQKLDDTAATAGLCTPVLCMENFLSDVKRLLKDSSMHDVELKCENKVIKAHRSILSCRSGMFEGMFRSGTREALEGKVFIQDTSLRIFEKIINYMYTAEIKFENLDFACNVYIEADKFLIKALKERCIHYIKTILSLPFSTNNVGSRVADACKVLYLADKHADNSFKEWVKNYLANPQLLMTSEWSIFSDHLPDLAIEVFYKLFYNTTNL